MCEADPEFATWFLDLEGYSWAFSVVEGLVKVTEKAQTCHMSFLQRSEDSFRNESQKFCACSAWNKKLTGYNGHMGSTEKEWASLK